MIEPRPIYSKSSKTPGKIIGWLARWYGPDGRQHSRACRTKSAARKHARDMESLRDAGRYPNERRRKPDAVSTMCAPSDATALDALAAWGLIAGASAVAQLRRAPGALAEAPMV